MVKLGVRIDRNKSTGFVPFALYPESMRGVYLGEIWIAVVEGTPVVVRTEPFSQWWSVAIY